MRAEPLIVCDVQEIKDYVFYQLNRNLFTNHGFKLVVVDEKDLYIYYSKECVLMSRCDALAVL